MSVKNTEEQQKTKQSKKATQKKTILKNTQFNLPVDLIDRIGAVADRYHAGNKSHFVRAALQDAVEKIEKSM